MTKQLDGPDPERGSTAEARALSHDAVSRQSGDAPVLITGGAGFIGCRLADFLAERNRRVRVLDSLVRPGSGQNLAWLRSRHGDRIEAVQADLRDHGALRRALRGASVVFHLAANVARSDARDERWRDFEVNAAGTLGLLEEMIAGPDRPHLLFTSTSKVYGRLEGVELRLRGDRFEPVDPMLRHRGVAEGMDLSFATPHGCSMGSAEQYVLDFARIHGLSAAVLRIGCVYGPRQPETGEYGWVARALGQALRGEPVDVHGDGLQVRDLLFIDDLVAALVSAERCLPRLAGRAVNLGGGPGRSASALELLTLIDRVTARRHEVRFRPPHPGDATYFVSDTGCFRDLTGWQPRVGLAAGIESTLRWLDGRQRAHARPAELQSGAVARRMS